MHFFETLLCGDGLALMILGVGVLLTFRCRLIQIRRLGKALRCVLQKEEGAGEVSAFGSLCTALSATIGTGNIVGVAAAIAAGGPGALSWMLIAAFFGMATKYAEGLLAVKYRRADANGHVLGGPFCYIEDGLSEVSGGRWKPLARTFALFGVLAGLAGIGTITQSGSIAAAADRVIRSRVLFGSTTRTAVVTGAVVTFLTAIVICGGVRRIAAVSGVVVPVMAAAYMLCTVSILLCSAAKIPAAVCLIFRSTLCPQAAGGAAAGITLRAAVRIGVRRGIFSNEAGLGSAPIAAAAAKTNSPARQGLIAMTGTFFDTVILCTMTGLAVVVTGAWQPAVADGGFGITSLAWRQGLPLPADLAQNILSACLIVFAFTTIIGWNYYAEKCLEYLVGRRPAVLFCFRLLYIAAVAAGPYLRTEIAWRVADVCNAMMAFPNLIALIVLSGVVARNTGILFKKDNCGEPNV